MLLNSLTRLLEWKMACMLLKDNRLNNQKAPTKGWETSVTYKLSNKNAAKVCTIIQHTLFDFLSITIKSFFIPNLTPEIKIYSSKVINIPT